MFDTLLINLTRTPLRWVSAPFIALGIPANAVTLSGLVTSFFIFFFLTTEHFIIALIFVSINRILDGVDGFIARTKKTKSVSGGFLDIVVDYVFYGAVPLGMAFYNQDYAIPTAIILYTYMISGVLFMSSSASAAKLNIESHAFKHKSLYYPINFIEGSETILYCILACIFPLYFPIFTYIMAGLLLVSMPIRTWVHFKNFKKIECSAIHNKK